MAHMDLQRRIGLVCFAVLTSTACHRVSYGPDSLKIDEFRYSVGSAVVGAGLDTLRVAIVVVNGSRKEGFLSFPHCPPILSPVKALVRSGDKEWNSEISEVRKQPEYFDSSGKAIPQVCLAYLVGVSFPPGSSYTYVLKVPVTEVLGDSLPAGRYRVIAQLRLNGFLTRRFSAGDVQLAAPRHLTNVAADKHFSDAASPRWWSRACS